ncbi:MAG: DUF4407 domain-containing protein [Pedobacter sp.]|uniref:DUF4407 domain-containing protein n=1 Tax=Pedobacter sp. TaxID=1411316 RepID=UPI002807991F|nr:DUF4407 domain-containing protein [Pedobacter sp.]MDQ8003383.1 DUF4407 domain-containing protein [Pedobacter sp.]
MNKFQRWWVKFGCFLTGYDFNLLSNCSEVAVRKVKKYTAALIIISIIWAFVGYTFCNRYIKLGPYESLFGALIATIIVLQIERQILMVQKSSNGMAWVRGTIAVLMAFIGALVIDQIIFKDDIEKAKMQSNQEKVNQLMPLRSAELIRQLKELDTTLHIKEIERANLLADINANPTIKIVEISKSQVPTTTVSRDTLQGTISKVVMKNVQTTNLKSIQNPKYAQLAPLDTQMAALLVQKTKKEAVLLDLRNELEVEVGSKIGFLDELNMMMQLLSESSIAIVVYAIWFLFLLFLELLILISKRSDSDSDYDMAIQHQMAVHNKKIQLLMKSQNL